MTSLRLILPASALVLLLLTPATSYAVCCGGECCSIDGACHSRGDDNPANPCQECDPSTSQFAWTAIPGCVPTDAGSGSADAGSLTPDAGTSTPDAGTSTADAGTSMADAGTSADPDAGSVTPMDGGSSGTPDAGGGGEEAGGCAVHPGRSDAPLAALFGLALGVLVWRRRAR